MINETFKVKATIVACLRKPCSHYKIGDSWIIEHLRTPDGMCPGMYFNIAFAMESMIKTPGLDVMEVSCPDTKSIMIYEVRKLNP